MQNKVSKPTVAVIIEGYADETRLQYGGVARYRPTITLIQANNATIIVDPGSVERQQDIVRAWKHTGYRRQT
jgi:hypothetical protein